MSDLEAGGWKLEAGKKKMPWYRRVQYNAPAVLTFALMAAAALALQKLTAGAATSLLFSVYPGSLSDPLFYARLFGHVLGHANFAHFSGNFTLILIAGPMLEEKYGSRNMAAMMTVTALVTGVLHAALAPAGQAMLGASGIVFMLILLSSFVNLREGRVPLTLIICVVAFIAPEVSAGIAAHDHVAHYAHIIGGLCGAGFGYLLARGKPER